MPIIAVIHSEWIKIRSLRSSAGSLVAVFGVTVALAVLVSTTVGQAEAHNTGHDPVFGSFYAVNFGQIAAISFGATAVSSEYHGGALRISLSAVPDRKRFYAAKMTVVGALALSVGILTTFTTFLCVQLFMGRYAIGLDEPGALRATIGGGVYLALLALLAAGATALLRSGTATLSILIPFVLIASFVVGDTMGSVADYLPDRAGQLVLHQHPDGSIGPWTGLMVTAAWAASAMFAGRWATLRRDA
ncbi:ABC transporter permease [Streptomyces marianii]|uniref:ABC transporter permease n=1 Tax=Streptomyces marianii TaxID=1817406 RepID=A0A5R9EEV5_9ACTN|nr:ABC transporter permease [Streptomyces marianii]TLQ47242.1 ABC transporter permease [Streptomyces marianii]